ncbi:NAD-dependent epimerase/dehydratase family protein [Antrihabitans cavernicola]|uniref:NAD-dependent epimerase/dehydratase family protein n=1 Tax=Antrihabitans cavernicola TaxID=2495913 RepID=A0A5A7SIH4_9NOCA|nr:NAD-dependent epimerase/dehydratase family protein [Spelaeibacter cavernicola]KAA0024992.1 NAD-dependent epimerase/dehydratase family protein [Spelaeibacter cavernicola]
MSELHVVTGAGPVGWTVAQQLAEQGHSVRVLTRSGSGPEHPLIERRRVDVSKPDQLDDAFDGAVAVFHCIHGSAYSAKTWRAELPAAEKVVLDAAGRAGAVVVFPESLYSYGEVDQPMTEDMPRNATVGKLGVRAELLRAREASSTPTVSVIASDFFGPQVLTAHAGERMVPTILDGKTMRVIASLDQPHSFTYIPDYAAAMIAAAHDRSVWNTVLHAPTAPAVTQRQLIETFAAAGGVAAPKMSAIPVWVLRAAGVASSEAKELAETAYMFAKPFVIDSSRSEQKLGLAPTPLADAAKTTVEWWQARRG